MLSFSVALLTANYPSDRLGVVHLLTLGARLRAGTRGDTEAVTALPHWPPGTVAILVTTDTAPHAIPVSAVVRAGDARLLIALAASRGSLERLRDRPGVAVAVLGPGLAFTAEGVGEVIAERLTEATVAVAVTVSTVHDHTRPTFAIDAGVRWHWTDSEAEARDAEVQAALARLADG